MSLLARGTLSRVGNPDVVRSVSWSLGDGFKEASILRPFELQAKRGGLRPEVFPSAANAGTAAFMEAAEAERAAALAAHAHNSDPVDGPLLLRQIECVLVTLVNSVHGMR